MLTLMMLFTMFVIRPQLEPRGAKEAISGEVGGRKDVRERRQVNQGRELGRGRARVALYIRTERQTTAEERGQQDSSSISIENKLFSCKSAPTTHILIPLLCGRFRDAPLHLHGILSLHLGLPWQLTRSDGQVVFLTIASISKNHRSE
ncbi:hypothetical protein E2320_002025 [Naja naja]|nr:hypothetical protein E2320_002025 [Naja naja]